MISIVENPMTTWKSVAWIFLRQKLSANCESSSVVCVIALFDFGWSVFTADDYSQARAKRRTIYWLRMFSKNVITNSVAATAKIDWYSIVPWGTSPMATWTM